MGDVAVTTEGVNVNQVLGLDAQVRDGSRGEREKPMPKRGYYDANPITDQKSGGISLRLARRSNTLPSTHQVDRPPFLPMSKHRWEEARV